MITRYWTPLEHLGAVLDLDDFPSVPGVTFFVLLFLLCLFEMDAISSAFLDFLVILGEKMPLLLLG